MRPRALLAIAGATVWIAISEFFRNQILLSGQWAKHYQSMDLTFPAAPVNGAIWGLWSLVFASVIYAVARRFSFRDTVVLAWVVGFLMMWLVIGNLGVLPYGILPYALPLSLLEVVVATLIVKRGAGSPSP